MNSLKNKYGNWALITGASSGLGEEFARQLAESGFNLVLIARRKEKLELLSEALIAKNNIETLVLPVDLSQADFLSQITEKCKDLEIGLVINNAGFAITGSFFNDQLENQLSLLYVNCRALLSLSHYFGNKMIANGKGGIINIASTAAFFPMPYWSNYAASKAFVLNLSEALWYETKGKGVDVLAVCPGATKTEFAEKAGVIFKGMSAGEVVHSALKNLGKRPSIVVGAKNRIAAFMSKFFSRKMLTKLGAKAVKMMSMNTV